MRLAIILSLLLTSFCAAQEHTPGTFYPNPGIVAFKGGQWVGSDHLYNLSDKLAVVVEIFKPETLSIPLDEKEILDHVVESLKQAKITTALQSSESEPTLPFFHLLIMLYPIDKGFVSHTQGRLFEKVQLDRVQLDKQAVMQAITWESQTLNISPEEDVKNQITKSVDEVTDAFVNRYKFFESIKAQIKTRG